MKPNLLQRLLLPRSLRYQLLSRSLLILSVLLMLIGVFQYVFMEQFLYSNRAGAIQSQIRAIHPQEWMQVAENAGTGDTNARNEWRGPLFSLHIADATVAFVDRGGKVSVLFAESRSVPMPTLSKEAYQQAMAMPPPPRSGGGEGGSNHQIIEDAQGNAQLVVLQPVGPRDQPLGLVQVSMSTRMFQDVLMRQLLIFAGLSLLALVAGLLTFLPILRRTLVPLSRMVETVEQINAGNLNERLPVDQGQTETDRLAASFNDMMERLEVAFAAEQEAKEQMSRFIADASHELRTPLTSIHGFLEVLLRGAAAHPDQLQTALRSMYGESERLKKLVHDLLLLARLDRAPDLQMREGRLGLVVLEMEPQLRMLAGERHVEIAVPAEGRALFDQDRMKQVILNLFQNAVQHTDPLQGKIQVALQRSDDGIRFSVRDDGPGIPAEHLPHLFERFYRIDTARTRTSGGAGLGLSITHSLVELHGGRIGCSSTPGEGTVFHVWLPACP